MRAAAIICLILQSDLSFSTEKFTFINISEVFDLPMLLGSLLASESSMLGMFKASSCIMSSILSLLVNSTGIKSLQKLLMKFFVLTTMQRFWDL